MAGAPISAGLGLLGGLAQGLQSGVESYTKVRDSQEAKAKREEDDRIRRQQLGLLAVKSGVEIDPMTGEYVKDANSKLEEEAKLNPLRADSAGSKFYRGLLGKYSKGVEVPESLTEAEGSKAFDSLIKADTATQNRKLHEAIIGAATTTKNEKRITDLSGKLQRDLEPDASRTGNFGQISNTLIQAQKLKRLATDANGSIANLPKAQQEEMAIGMARMISGAGGTTDSRINALVPQSARGDVNATMSWLLNDPKGADQQAFTKQMLGTIEREEALAKTQLRGIQTRRLGAHSELRKLSPDAYQQILNNYGLGEEEAQPSQRGLLSPGGRGSAVTPLNVNDPRIKAALDAGYTQDEIMEHMNAR